MTRQSVLRRQLAAGHDLTPEEPTEIVVAEPMFEDEADFGGITVDELAAMALAEPPVICLKCWSPTGCICTELAIVDVLLDMGSRNRHPSRYANPLENFDIVACAVRICQEIPG